MEYREKYRPKTIDEIIGQPTMTKQLKTFFAKGKVPHAMLFSGPPGCGKTTAARVVARLLFCVGTNLVEINSADFRGIDKVRELTGTIGLQPLGGKTAVYIIDECHQLTKPAQDALLKTLEDITDKYQHAYIFLCTTDPGKLIAAIRSRCTEIPVKPVSSDDLLPLLGKVIKAENLKVTKEVANKIIERANGSPRKALVLLEQISGLPTPEDQTNAIAGTDEELQGIDIARLIFNKKSQWPDIAKAIQQISGDDIESIRHIVLGYASAMLLKNVPGMASRAFLVIQAFRDHWYDCKAGKAGLAAACYEVFGSKG